MKSTCRLRAAVGSLALVLLLGACGQTPAGGGDTETQPGSGEGKLFATPTELSITIGSHVSWPYNENWVMWKYIEEATNTKLQIQAIPSADMATKLPLMMAAPETLPDLLHTWQKKESVDAYALSGAFVSYDDNPELMGNYQAFWNSLPEEERKDAFAQRTSGDGKIYSAPAYGTHTVNNLRTWMYRKDIFDKHGLAAPTTAQELYQTAKQLKELYPDSYPLCFRDGIGKLILWGPSWQPYMDYMEYYDYTDNTWKFGVKEPGMKQMVEYFLTLKNEGLVPPDYITMETKSWEELMTTDRGFISLDYIVRIDYFNLPARQQNPDYTLALMAPPKPESASGSQLLPKTNLDMSGYCVCNTGKKERIENALRFVDWMYTDEACELLSWGKQGETYEVADGEKQFILEGDEQPQNKYGVGTYGLYERLDTAANEAMYSREQVEACHQVLSYLEPRSNPSGWMPLNSEEESEAAVIKDDLKAYVTENLSKFLLGQRPMSEWDAFLAGVDEMNAPRLLEIYDAAYTRVLEG